MGARFCGRLLLVIAGCLPLSGCAEYVIGKVWLDRDRAKVYVTENASEITDCTFVKQVKAKSYWGGLALQNEALEKCISVLTHNAARAGANVLLIRDSSRSIMGSSAVGDAYLCKEVKFAPKVPQLTTSQEPESLAVSDSQDKGISERLVNLKELKDKGILTEEEYNEKRKELIDKL